MASVIGKIESLDGKFYIKEKDGSLRELERGDEIHEGEIVVGSDGNSPTNSAVVLLDDGTSIIISGNEKQLFDSSLVKEAFEESETVTDEKSIESLFDNTSLFSQDDQADDNSDELETAAGAENLNSGEFLESSFAEFDLKDAEVHADVKETEVVVHDSSDVAEVVADVVDEAYLSYLEESLEQTQTAIVEANSAAQVAQESANIVVNEPTVSNLEDAEAAQQSALEAANSANEAADKLETALNQLDTTAQTTDIIDVNEVKGVISNARDAAQNAISAAESSETQTDALIAQELIESQEAQQTLNEELQDVQNAESLVTLDSQGEELSSLLDATQEAQGSISSNPETLAAATSLSQQLLNSSSEYIVAREENLEQAQANMTEAQEAVAAANIAISTATKAIENAEAANEDTTALENILADAQGSLVTANDLLSSATSEYETAQIELNSAQAIYNQAQELSVDINNAIDEVISSQIQNVATLTQAAEQAAEAANDAAEQADKAAIKADAEPTPQNLAAAEQAQDAATTAATEATNAANTLEAATTTLSEAADAANESVSLESANAAIAAAQEAATNATQAATASEATTDSEIATMIQNVATLTQAAEQAAEAANDAAEQADKAAIKADAEPTPQNLAAAEQAQDAATTAATEATNAANTLEAATTTLSEAADAANESVDLTEATQVVAQTQDAALSANEAASINDRISNLSDSDSTENSVVENAVDGTYTGVTLHAVDPDSGDSVTYELPDDVPFSVDENGRVITNGELDFENQEAYTFDVVARSSDGSTSTQSVTINVSDERIEHITDLGGAESGTPVSFTITGDHYDPKNEQDVGAGSPKYRIFVNGEKFEDADGKDTFSVQGNRGYVDDNNVLHRDAQDFELVTFKVPEGVDPNAVSIEFVNDAWDGRNDRDGDGVLYEDRNLVVDSLNIGGEVQADGTIVGGETFQAEDKDTTLYTASNGHDVSGREVMPWSGTMTFFKEGVPDVSEYNDTLHTTIGNSDEGTTAIFRISGDHYDPANEQDIGQGSPKYQILIDGEPITDSNGNDTFEVHATRNMHLDEAPNVKLAVNQFENVEFKVPEGVAPESISIKFVNDAYDGYDRDGDGILHEDRNLIVDSLNIGGEVQADGSISGGITLEAENKEYSTYTASNGNDVSGREVMAWNGEMNFNMSDAGIDETTFNSAPDAVDDTASTDEDHSIIISASSLLANDSDVDGDNLTLQNVHATEDTHGTVELIETKAIDLNGSNDSYISVANSDSINMQGNSEMAIAMNLRLDSTPATDYDILVNKEGQYEVAVDTNGTVKFAMVTDNQRWAWHDSDLTLPVDGNFHDVNFIYDGSNVSLSVDGQSWSMPYTGEIGQVSNATHHSDSELRIGNRSYDGHGTYTTDMTVNEVKVYESSEMNQDNLALHLDFNSDNPLQDLSGNGNDAQIHDAEIVDSGVAVKFTPDADYTGEASFEYTVVDEGGATDKATVFIDIIRGDEEGVVLNYRNIHNETIVTEDGNDTINVHHDVTSSHIDTSAGNDEIYVDDIQRHSSVSMGEGNDTITMDDIRSGSTVDMGRGNDTIAGQGHHSQINDATIAMGEGDDSVTTHTIRGEADIDMGAGDDTVNAQTIGDSAHLSTGGGDDTVTIDRVEAEATIDTGSGDDSVALNDISGRFDEGRVDLGEGDDSLTLGDNLHGVDASFDLGAGDDTVTFESEANFNPMGMPFGLNDGMQIDLSEANLHNVEEINLGDGDQELTLNISDVLEVTDDDNILRIDGDTLDTLTLESDDNTEWKLGDFKTDEETGATYQEVIGVEDDATVTLEVNTDIQIDQS